MFESIMWQYIQEEKEILTQTLKDERIKDVANQIRNIWDIVIVAHGSSYHAAISIASIFEKVAGIHVHCMRPSQLLNNGSFDYMGLCIGISQTGTSKGVLEGVKALKKQGFSSLAITNDQSSPLTELCDDTLYLHCGKEDSNAKTKGYSATCLVLMRLALELALLNDKMSTKEYYEAMDHCREEVSELDQVIQCATHYFQGQEFGKGIENLYCIGDGIHFGTAMECALKVMETVCIPTAFNDSIELSHGMHRAINEHSTLVFIDDGSQSDIVKKSVDYFKKVGTKVLHISNQNNADIRLSKYPFTHSLFSFLTIIQVLSVFVAEINRLDPNREMNESYTQIVPTRV